MKLKLGICDDNPAIVLSIKEFILAHDTPYEIAFYTAHSGEEFFKKTDGVELDIAFLDIEMSNMNGLEVSQQIRNQSDRTLIIFITGHSGYALNAFKVKAFDYILKPITEKSFSNLFKSVLFRFEEIQFLNQNKKFTFKYKSQVISLSYNEIYYFEKKLNKVIIYTENEIFQTYTSIKKISDEMDSDIFIRTSEGCLINLNKVSELKDHHVILGDNIYQVPISRNRKKNVLEIFSKKLFT